MSWHTRNFYSFLLFLVWLLLLTHRGCRGLLLYPISPSPTPPTHTHARTHTHTHTHTPVRTPLDEGSAPCRDLYLTTHSIHMRDIHTPARIETCNPSKHTHTKEQHSSLYRMAAPACDGLCKQWLLPALGSQCTGMVMLWSSTQLWGQRSNFTLFSKYNTWVTWHVEVGLSKPCPIAKVPLMVGRRTQQTPATMVHQSLAPASHVQGDNTAGTHSNLHDLASLTRPWTAATNKTMTRCILCLWFHAS